MLTFSLLESSFHLEINWILIWNSFGVIASDGTVWISVKKQFILKSLLLYYKLLKRKIIQMTSLISSHAADFDTDTDLMMWFELFSFLIICSRTVNDRLCCKESLLPYWLKLKKENDSFYLNKRLYIVCIAFCPKKKLKCFDWK